LVAGRVLGSGPCSRGGRSEVDLRSSADVRASA
jgi:hypothetical protein